MSKKLPAFKRLAGIYKETWTPYEKFSEGADMSVLLEVEGKYYRILRNTLDQKKSRKLVVCREDGQIEESVEITRQCLNYLVYLGFYELAKRNAKLIKSKRIRKNMNR